MWTQAINAANSQTLLATNYLVAGGFNAVGSGAINLQGTAAGNSEYVEIVGWSASLGTSWAAIQNELQNGWTSTGYFGVSSIGDVILGPTGGPGVTIPGNVTGGLLGGLTMDAISVPEPGSIALMGLGGLSLLLFRRKK